MGAIIDAELATFPFANRNKSGNIIKLYFMLRNIDMVRSAANSHNMFQGGDSLPAYSH